jgi:hypothetical protein
MEMAFNPFHIVRKRQKVLMAIVAIFCMILFTLQFGTGDIFARLGLYGRNKENPVVTKLYGDKVTVQDVLLARKQREWAQQFMFAGTSTAIQKLSTESSEDRDSQDPEAFRRRMLQQSKLQRLYGLWGKYYFLDPRQQELDKVLDFMVWKHQADKLGIYLTREDIDQWILSTISDAVDLEAARQNLLASDSRDGYKPTLDQLYEALGNELRVRLAQQALGGVESEPPTPSFFGAPPVANDLKQTLAPFTPEEFWEFYKANRTTLDLAILPVAVKDFLDKVTEKPTNEQLEQLFSRYKEQEESPDKARPGFEEPRRVRVEWVGARADAPLYQKAADDFLLSLIAAVPLDPFPALALSGHFAKEYADETNKAKNFQTSRYLLPPITEPNFVLPFYTKLHEPDNVAALVGTLAGASTQGTFLPALVAFQSAAVAREVEGQRPLHDERPKNEPREIPVLPAVKREADKRVEVGAFLVMTGFDGNPVTTPILWAALNQTSQFLPMDAVAKGLVDQTRTKLAQYLVATNLERLQKDLDAVRGKPAEARKLLEEKLASYGVTGGSHLSKPDSKYEIVDDPALKPLKDEYARLKGGQPDPRGEKFAAEFFTDTTKYAPKPWPYASSSGEKPDAWVREEEPILYWKTEDVAAYVPTFEAARERVEKAWRFQKARELARKKAAEVASQATEKKGDRSQLLDLSASLNLLFETLGPVARLVPKTSARADISHDYEPFKFPEWIEFPRADFLDKVMGLTQPGNTVVLENRPETIFYVATLMKRTEPSLESFHDVYRDAAGADSLLKQFMKERSENFRREIVKQLRSEAAAVDDKGNYVIEPDVRDRLKVRGASSETE